MTRFQRHRINTLKARRRFGLFIFASGMLVLLAAGWDVGFAWRSGYGKGSLKHLEQADPRALSGGDMTTFHAGFKPFGQSPDNLPWQYEALFDAGDGLFDKPFAPGRGLSASQEKPGAGVRRSGLGPLFNAESCASCHFRDGRVEKPYVSGGEMLGMFLRFSVPDGKGGWQAPPGYHAQLHDRAVAGVKPEGLGHIDFEETGGHFPDGDAYNLRKPRYRVSQLGYGALPPDVVIEARTAPPLHGGGLLEAIDEATLLALATSQAKGVGGISGRPNYVIDPETGKRVIGRFSHKANEASLRAQAAGAAFNDMGVTSPVHRQENCLPRQHDCLAAKHGGSPQEPELSARQLEELTTYLQLLAVPARRGLDDPLALQGEGLFRQAGCNTCHVETLRTGNNHPLRRLRGQTIHPYTDLLLHDMGPGLTGRPDGEATAQEWRTPPLWGIGLTAKSNHHTHFLHDQRARNLQEAILWHDGEAVSARQLFMQMRRDERAALLLFLESL